MLEMRYKNASHVHPQSTLEPCTRCVLHSMPGLGHCQLSCRAVDSCAVLEVCRGSLGCDEIPFCSNLLHGVDPGLVRPVHECVTDAEDQVIMGKFGVPRR